MINSGVPDTVVDFWLGHVIGDMANAYKVMQFNDLKEMYAKRKHLLSISSSNGVEERLKREIEDKNKQLQDLVTNIVTENIGLKNKVSLLENNLKQTNEKFEEIIKGYEGFRECFFDWSPDDFSALSFIIQDYKDKHVKPREEAENREWAEAMKELEHEEEEQERILAEAEKELGKEED